MKTWRYIHVQLAYNLHYLFYLYTYLLGDKLRMADANANAAAVNAAGAQHRADFDALLARIGFNADQRNAVIDISGCINVAMIGLLTIDQLSKMCKSIESRAVNPVVIFTVQEQFLLSLRHWVVNKQRLQEPIHPNEFTMVTALNQTQLMRQQAEDEGEWIKK